MNSRNKVTQLNTLTNKLTLLGNFIRKIRSKKDISIEDLAQRVYLKADTIRKIEAGRCLPIANQSFKLIEHALGIKRNELLTKVEEHRTHLVEFIELYHDSIVAMVDALRIYHNDEIDKILNETKYKWKQLNTARKEGDKKMATTRRTTSAKPAVKAAPKRSTKTAAKVTPMKRSTASRSTKRSSK